MIEAMKSRSSLPFSLPISHLCSYFNFVRLVVVFDLVKCLLFVVNFCLLVY